MAPILAHVDCARTYVGQISRNCPSSKTIDTVVHLLDAQPDVTGSDPGQPSNGVSFVKKMTCLHIWVR